MNATIKQYQCPACKALENISTEHFGEIFSGCNKCKNTVMYCIEPNAIEDREGSGSIQTTIISYRFDTKKQRQLDSYSELEYMLKLKGITKFNAQIKPSAFESIIKHTNATLFLSSIFSNQWVSSVGRLHDWFEVAAKNPMIKSGYYLAQNNEMLTVRENKFKCSQCNKVTISPNNAACGHGKKLMKPLIRS